MFSDLSNLYELSLTLDNFLKNGRNDPITISNGILFFISVINFSLTTLEL